MAEAILNHLGKDRYCATSAGNQAVGRIHPLALTILTEHGVPTTGLSSKSWERSFGRAAPPLDFIIIVCDDSYEEMVLPLEQQPIQAFWATPNPVTVGDNAEESRAAFEALYVFLESRVRAFLQLPIRELTRSQIWQRLMEIGKPSFEDRRDRQDSARP